MQLYSEDTSHWCFSVNLGKFLCTPFFYRTSQVATFETKNIHTSAADLLRIRIGNLEWNESHEKETKDIHASATNLLSIKIGNIDWCKC